MGLGEIFREVKDALTGNAENEPPQEADPNADPVYDQEQGIRSASEDPYGDPADQR